MDAVQNRLYLSGLGRYTQYGALKGTDGGSRLGKRHRSLLHRHLEMNNSSARSCADTPAHAAGGLRTGTNKEMIVDCGDEG